MTKVCGICGKWFKTLVVQQIYCNTCSGTKKYYVPKKKEKRVCEFSGCKKVFETSQPNAKFCCDDCRKRAHYDYVVITKTCKWCGEMFSTTNSKRDYCTPAHSKLAKDKRNAERSERRRAEKKAAGGLS